MQGTHALLIEGFAYTNRFTINVPDRSVLCSVMPAFPTKRVLSSCFFFLLAHQTDLLPFQCQCIGKSKGSIRYSVQQGSNKNNHMYTEHGYYLMDKSTFSLIYARLFIFSFDWTWFYYLTSLKLFVQRLHQVYIMRCSNCSVKQNMMLHINDV